MKYRATYTEPLTGRTEIVTRAAGSYTAALYELPRWIYPNGKPMRRKGAPRIAKDTNQ